MNCHNCLTPCGFPNDHDGGPIEVKCPACDTVAMTFTPAVREPAPAAVVEPEPAQRVTRAVHPAVAGALAGGGLVAALELLRLVLGH